MRTVFTASDYTYSTQGSGARRYARASAAVHALALDAAGVPGVRIQETVRHLYPPGAAPRCYGWRGESWPAETTAHSFAVLVPDDVTDQAVAVARMAPAVNLAGRARLAWALGANAWALTGAPMRPVGQVDPLDFAPPTDGDRAILARLDGLTLPPVSVPYTAPPPAPPRPWAGECPDGHGPAPKAFPAVTRGRWARVWRCGTCGRSFDPSGFTLTPV